MSKLVILQVFLLFQRQGIRSAGHTTSLSSLPKTGHTVSWSYHKSFFSSKDRTYGQLVIPQVFLLFQRQGSEYAGHTTSLSSLSKTGHRVSWSYHKSFWSSKDRAYGQLILPQVFLHFKRQGIRSAGHNTSLSSLPKAGHTVICSYHKSFVSSKDRTVSNLVIPQVFLLFQRQASE